MRGYYYNSFLSSCAARERSAFRSTSTGSVPDEQERDVSSNIAPGGGSSSTTPQSTRFGFAGTQASRFRAVWGCRR